ncbi:redoxin domain-containing protein [Sphingobacterium siyangense]|jgi:thiol-disulfide isomerase/thioredoxin|uniref:redoxin domain-containing protein n=1 Tax=Sphingobacterium siyangense TaxID=459529 RepID=UPI0028A9F935|nr:redoxin domain-containing protein [Sphingobacterium siyangense]
MKHILKIAALMVVPMMGMAQKKFVLDGELKNGTTEKLYLFYMDGQGKQVTDSASVLKNHFQFKGTLTEPTLVFLTRSPNPERAAEGDYTQMYLESTKMKLEFQDDNLKNYTLTGSKLDAEHKQLELEKSAIRKGMEPISKAYALKNKEYSRAERELEALEKKVKLLSEEAASIKNQFEPFNEKAAQIDMTFIKNHPQSFLSPYLLIFRMNNLSLEETETLFAGFSKEVQNSRFGKDISEKLEESRSGAVGKIAPVFSTTDIDGKALSLSDFRGKYVLLDFWASWCVPCRKGNPHLIKLYQQYKSKGFEIIGIADDDSKPEKWHKAVEQDEIGIWKHILRGAKFDGTNFDLSKDVTKGYGVSSLPTKVLIDPQGVIIGRYGGGNGGSDEQLDAKLAEVFK